MNETLQGVIAILHTIRVALTSSESNENDVEVLSGLYTFAVEEFGKLSVLAQCVPSNGQVRIDRGLFRGREAHQRKFRAALGALPSECTNLVEGAFSRAFASSAFQTSVVSDLEARMSAFYADINQSGETVTPVPPVEREQLMRAVTRMEEIAMWFSIPS